MALDKDLLAKVKAGFKKQAFVPAGGDPAAAGGDPAAAGGGMPPVDPATGMPIDPATGMPMDPSMMGGGMPMDPSMMGGGMPPMDPAAAGGMPPPGDPAAGGAPAGGEELSPEGEPYIKLTFSQLLAAFDKIFKLAQRLSGAGQQNNNNNNNGGNNNNSDLQDIKTLLMTALGR